MYKSSDIVIMDKQQYLLETHRQLDNRKYYTSKIHKAPATWTVPYEIHPGRPTVSDCWNESYNSAQYIDHFYNPLSQLQESYL